MPALFPRWTNSAYRLALLLLPSSIVGLLTAMTLYVRTPWNTAQYDAPEQPVEFDHRHHVIDDEIDCLYCHAGARVSDFAGVPATEVCMGCHSQIYNRSPLLEPVRQSYFSGKALGWNRVHDLPDFTYFNHAVHVNSGIGCVHCHGRVDLMARVYKAEPLTMGWCLDCHGQAQALLQYAAHQPPSDRGSLWGSHPELWDTPPSLGPRHVDALTTCSTCHR